MNGSTSVHHVVDVHLGEPTSLRVGSVRTMHITTEDGSSFEFNLFGETYQDILVHVGDTGQAV